MKVFGDSGIFPFKLDKHAKTQIWAFGVPLVIAGDFIFIREYLRYISKRQCGNSHGLSFDLYGSYGYTLGDLFFLSDLPCTDGYNQFVYKVFGVLLCIFIGLSIMLPFILYLRRRPVEQTKLFE